MPDQFEFRPRAREVSRTEAFSDVVFGFALTLIVVSLEVPETFAELVSIMRGVPAFAICFAILVWIWYEHHRFFRRYNMQDGLTIALNAALLFVVLFYTYPLKFIFALNTGLISRSTIHPPTLFAIYGAGFAGIFVLLLSMYLLAYRRREALGLNEFEIHDSITTMWMYTAYIAIGLVSIILGFALTGDALAIAGLIYFLLGPVSGIIGYARGRKRDALQSRQVESAQTLANASETMAVPTVAANGL
jgi:uncharacterized membrane protein